MCYNVPAGVLIIQVVIICCSLSLHVLSTLYLSMYSGIWDVMSNEEVLEFVRRRIADNMSPAAVSIDCELIQNIAWDL